MTPSIAFIGAGRVARTLALAFVRQGIAVDAVASRSDTSAHALAVAVDGARMTTMAEAAMHDLVFVTVPDDDIAPTCERLAWRTGQGVVHCSGATEVSALAHAADAGATVGGFHPLQNFSDPDRAVDLLAGATVAIEAPPALDELLREIARRLDMRPIALPPGARAAYHGGASFAASFVASMIEEAVTMWRGFGVDEADALRALLPLAQGSLANVASRGLVGAISGPISRGDAGVVERHLVAFDAEGPEHGALYREFGRRQLRLAIAGGRLDPAQAERLRALLA